MQAKVKGSCFGVAFFSTAELYKFALGLNQGLELLGAQKGPWEKPLVIIVYKPQTPVVEREQFSIEFSAELDQKGNNNGFN